MRNILLTAIAAFGLVGCVGGISSEGGDPLQSPDGDGNDNGDNPAGSDLSAAKQLFDSNVYPVINAKCTGGEKITSIKRDGVRSYREAPARIIDPDKTYTAVLKTNRGDINLSLAAKDAPTWEQPSRVFWRG